MNSEDFQDYSSSQKGGPSRWNTEIMVVAGLVAGLVAGRSRIGKLALLATAGGLVWRYLHQRNASAIAPQPVPPSKPAPVSVVEAHVSELVASYWDQPGSHSSTVAVDVPSHVDEPPFQPQATSPFVLVEPSIEVPEKKVVEDSKWAPMLAEALLLGRSEEASVVESTLTPDPLFQNNLTIADILGGPSGEPEEVAEVEAFKEVHDEPAVEFVTPAKAEEDIELADTTPTGEFEAVSEPVWVEVEPGPVLQKVSEPLVEAPTQPVFASQPGPETQLMSSAAWLLGLEPMPMISAASAVAVVPGRSDACGPVIAAAPTPINLGAEIPDRIEIPEHIAQVPADVPPVPQIENTSMRPITKGFLNKVLETVDVRPKTVPLLQPVELPKPKLAIPLASADVPMTSPLVSAANESNPEAAKPTPRPTSWLAAELAANIAQPVLPDSAPEAKAPSRRIQPLAPATAGEKKAWLEWWK
ncbi:MAG: hypothetical protein JNM99_05660 [Verrucomicrobiaceae bacterium]|nr:hypothetical protein [Verrucomicrobiaceae bacterium]